MTGIPTIAVQAQDVRIGDVVMIEGEQHRVTRRALHPVKRTVELTFEEVLTESYGRAHILAVADPEHLPPRETVVTLPPGRYASTITEVTDRKIKFQVQGDMAHLANDIEISYVLPEEEQSYAKEPRKFPVLQRQRTDDFECVKLAKDRSAAPWGPDFGVGTWVLMLDEWVAYSLPLGLVQATVDYTEEEVALMWFDRMLEMRNNAVGIGYDFGKRAAQKELRAALGIEETEE